MGGSTWLRRSLALAAPLLLFYLVLELGFSLLCVYGWIMPQRSLMVYENSDRTILFDPVIGYRYSEVPARVAQVVDGKVENAGLIAGNKQGFPDRRDFTVRRLPNESLRLAVLGDSFSALKTIERRWPETLEDTAAGEGVTVRLLNFSVGGGGLANWWNILHRLIVAESYELDGVVFAVYDDPVWGDLHRPFYMLDHAHGGVRLGLAPSWDPETWPRTWKEAEPLLVRRARVILDPDTFERMLEGTYRPRWRRPWRPYLASLALGRPVFTDANPYRRRLDPTSNEFLSAGPLRLTEQLAATCREQGWPVYVVRVASRGDALGQTRPSGVVSDFAEKLGAELIDGAEAFRGLTQEQLAGLWFPTDGHWNQRGSDAFARMMWDRIRPRQAPSKDSETRPPPPTS